MLYIYHTSSISNNAGCGSDNSVSDLNLCLCYISCNESHGNFLVRKDKYSGSTMQYSYTPLTMLTYISAEGNQVCANITSMDFIDITEFCVYSVNNTNDEFGLLILGKIQNFQQKSVCPTNFCTTLHSAYYYSLAITFSLVLCCMLLLD